MSRELQAAGADHADTITELARFALLGIRGRDRITFLQGQFTCDVNAIPTNTISHGAWCNTKGRVLANFLLCRLDTELLLLLPGELKDNFLKRLRMYVLRADVTITDLTQSHALLGITVEQQHASINLLLQELPQQSYQITCREGLIIGRLPGTPTRYLLCATQPEAQTLRQQIEDKLQPVDERAWQLQEILAGLPWVIGATSEQFLPQSLNLDTLGGLSYNKGCYLGQEIIARMHFRGQLKQRMYRAAADTANDPLPGSKLYMPGAEQSVGAVVNTARHPEGGCSLLIICDIEQARDNHLHIGSPEGDVIRFIE